MLRKISDMQIFGSCLNIGLVILSYDYRVVGMNAYAKRILGTAMPDLGNAVFKYHPRKSHQKIEALLQGAHACDAEMPAAMIIDVLNKVLMINVCKIEMENEPLIAMTFIDVTEQTGAKLNPDTGMVELKKFPVCDRGEFLFLDMSSIYFIRSDGNYCKVFTKSSSYYLHLSLKTILKRYVGSKFFRVHKSFIVNIEHIRKIHRNAKGQTFIIFDRENLPDIPVARRRVGDLKETLLLT